MKTDVKLKIAIIGAGASGCFAAANLAVASAQHIEIKIFEKSDKILQKVKISGGGRCNLTHQANYISELLPAYPRGKQLLKKTLAQFDHHKTQIWFQEKGITLKTESDGRVFPTSDRSQTIINCLIQEMAKNKVEILHHKSIQKLIKRNEIFELYFTDQSVYRADKVLVAIGGLPKLEQYHFLQALGHRIESPVPSLFTFNLSNKNIKKHEITTLMGLSIPDVKVKIIGTKLSSEGIILMTHWGFSGPAVLRLSALAARELANLNYQFQISITWININAEQLNKIFEDLRQKEGKQKIKNQKIFNFPQRFWEYQLTQAEIDLEKTWNSLNSKEKHKLSENLLNDIYTIEGKTIFKEEFVTAGGIDLTEINLNTMESKLIKNLYFAGEILDVDGITGGYNFQHAWSSAWVAAKNMI